MAISTNFPGRSPRRVGVILIAAIASLALILTPAEAQGLAQTSDCRATTVGSTEVRAAELQLLTSRPQVDGATLTD
jgi:hypothetical protein